MNMSTDPSIRLQMKELQLNSLFEVIQAINDNASEDHLYKIYRFTIHANQYVDKLALFVWDEKWHCKVVYGTQHDYTYLYLSPALQEITEITDLQVFKEIGVFGEFDKAIPIRHKDVLLAVVLVGKSSPEIDENLLDLSYIEALSNIMLVAIENKKLVRKQLAQKAITQQLNIAKEVQTLLFPKKLPYHDSLKVVADYLPHHSVGGDYYDFIQKNKDQFLVCIADVSGKGVPAAILMSNFQAALRILIKKGTDLRNTVEELNSLIMQNSGGDNFITAFFAEYDAKERTFTYINAGHNPPFLFMPNNKRMMLTEGSTLLGGFHALPFLNIAQIDNLENFLLFCFTDGFIETYNEKGEEFGSEHLESFINENKHLEPKELHEILIKRLYNFKGENAYADDITLLSCWVRGNSEVEMF